MGIVRVKEFEEEFEQEEIEIYALLRKVPNGAAVYSKDCLRPLAYTEATVDCKTGALDRQLRAYAAGHMLDTANDWLGDADEEPITAEQFADRITLSELAFRNDGSIEAYYDDGDIFWGHCIIVRMDKNGNIEDAEIAG